MCGSAPVFENATTWPTLAVIVAGSNAKSLIETATAPASFVSLHDPAAADVAADGAAADAAAEEAAGDDPLDEQAASTSARPAMRVPSERRDIRSSFCIHVTVRRAVGGRFPPLSCAR